MMPLSEYLHLNPCSLNSTPTNQHIVRQTPPSAPPNISMRNAQLQSCTMWPHKELLYMLNHRCTLDNIIRYSIAIS